MGKKGSVAATPFPDKDWQAEDDHRTLTRAQEIREDAGRMSGVRKHHQKTKRQLGAVGRSLRGGR